MSQSGGPSNGHGSGPSSGQSSGQSSGWSPELPPEPAASASGREPLPDLIARLIDEGKDYARAEQERARVVAGFYAVNIRDIALLAVVALIILFALLVASMVGAMLILSPYVGPLAAFAIVMGGGLVLTLILLALAMGRIKRLMEPRR